MLFLWNMTIVVLFLHKKISVLDAHWMHINELLLISANATCFMPKYFELVFDAIKSEYHKESL